MRLAFELKLFAVINTRLGQENINIHIFNDTHMPFLGYGGKGKRFLPDKNTKMLSTQMAQRHSNFLLAKSFTVWETPNKESHFLMYIKITNS